MYKVSRHTNAQNREHYLLDTYYVSVLCCAVLSLSVMSDSATP